MPNKPSGMFLDSENRCAQGLSNVSEMRTVVRVALPEQNETVYAQGLSNDSGMFIKNEKHYAQGLSRFSEMLWRGGVQNMGGGIQNVVKL